MNESNRFSLTIDAFTELAEAEQALQAAPRPKPPTLKSVIADVSPLPHETLFLGLAEDGLPVLLNLYDSIPGPILIAGDQASGKTALLKTIARAVELMHSPEEVQYGVVTQYPDEWNNFQGAQNNAGIYIMQDGATQELLQSLVAWAHSNKGKGQSVLLLIDDLEAIAKPGSQAEQNLRWLLLRGTSRRVWIFATLNASHARNMEAWLDFFRARLFGRIQAARDAQFVAGVSNEAFSCLTAGAQFAMREGDVWLNFLIPTIDDNGKNPSETLNLPTSGPI